MKLVLIDDHYLFRLGVRGILAATSEWTVVGEASRARDAFPIVEAERPDIVLMDVALVGSMDGVVATREVRRRAPTTRVVILTVHQGIRDVVDALDAGASAYILKTESTEAILGALAAVMRGERYVTPTLAEQLAADRSSHQASDVLKVLSEREREVFRLAAECLVTRDIARELCISRKTVDTHLYRIHLKLGLRTAAELVRLASRIGLTHSGRLYRGDAAPPVAASDDPVDVTVQPDGYQPEYATSPRAAGAHRR
jgi:DNA-binding NarL/FixJ family response regulator